MSASVKESNKSKFDSYSVRNSVLNIPHISCMHFFAVTADYDVKMKNA